LTVNVNWVVWLFPPPVPVTVIGYEPVGVDEDVDMVNVLVKVGLPEDGLNEGEAPEGRPDADKDTA